MIDLDHESQHWFGLTLKEFRENYPKLIEYAQALEFELKIYKECLSNEKPSKLHPKRLSRGKDEALPVRA